jgi:hypothetical protein
VNIELKEEDHKFLLNCVLLMEPFFSDNIPVMPYVVYRTLKHWQVFVNDDDKLLTKILTTIENTTQVPILSFPSTLIHKFILQSN